jgi:hypothetical protein
MKNYKVSFNGAQVSSSSATSTGSKIISAKSASEAKEKMKSQYYSINITSVNEI